MPGKHRPTAAEIAAATNAPVTAESLARAEIIRDTSRPKSVFSMRIDKNDSDELAAEAVRRGVKPTQLAAQFVAEGLARAKVERNAASETEQAKLALRTIANFLGVTEPI